MRGPTGVEIRVSVVLALQTTSGHRDGDDGDESQALFQAVFLFHPHHTVRCWYHPILPMKTARLREVSQLVARSWKAELELKAAFLVTCYSGSLEGHVKGSKNVEGPPSPGPWARGWWGHRESFTEEKVSELRLEECTFFQTKREPEGHCWHWELGVWLG